MPGSQFYTKKGLIAVLVHISPKAKKKLKLMAYLEDRTMQKVLQRIIREATGVKW